MSARSMVSRFFSRRNSRRFMRQTWALILSAAIFAQPLHGYAADDTAKTMTVQGWLNPKDALDAGAADLIQRQEQKARILGGEEWVARRRQDPYFVMGQRVIVQSAKASAQNEATKIQAFEKENINEKYVTPPRTYDLETDVELKVTPNTLEMSLLRLSGEPRKTVYTDVYQIPGILSVIKDKQHTHLLLKNGELYTIFMVHAKAFEANELAGEAPLMVPLIGTAPRELENADLSVPDDLKIEFFDSRQSRNYRFQDRIDAETIRDLRYGDVLMTRHLDSGVIEVYKIYTYAQIADVLRAHVTLLKTRETLLTRVEKGQILEGVFKTGGSAESLDASPRALEDIRQVLGASPGQTVVESAGLARIFRRTQTPWQQSVTEVRDLESSFLNIAAEFVDSARNQGALTWARSTYPIGAPATDNSPEAQMADFLKDLTSDEELARVKIEYAQPSRVMPVNKRTIFNTVAGFRVLGLNVKSLFKYGALAGAGALGLSFFQNFSLYYDTTINSFLSMMPDAVRSLEYKVPAFYGGPLMNYNMKLFLSCLALSAFVIAMPMVMAPFAKKVLGFKESSAFETGWRVYWTLALRTSARALYSLTEMGARLIGQGDKLQALRYGQDGATYNKYKKMGWDSSRIQTHLENLSLRSRNLATRLVVRNLVNAGVLSPETELDSKKLAHTLGASRFRAIQVRTALIEERLFDLLEQKSEATLLRGDAEVLENWALKDMRIQNMVRQSSNPQLTAAEATDFEKLKKDQLWTLRRVRLAGTNELYHRFKNGVIAANVSRTILTPAFSMDQHTIWPFAIPVQAFNDPAHPEMLMVSGDNILSGGLVGVRPFAEWGMNIVAWVGHAPIDQLTWANAQAVGISNQYLNPQLDSRTSVLGPQFEKNRPATFSEGAKSYLSAFVRPESVWMATEQLGNKMTIGQLKTLKVTLFLTGAVTALGYLLGITDVPEVERMAYIQSIPMMTIYKVILSNMIAYPTYRILWALHNVGAQNSVEIPIENKRRLDLLTTELTESLLAVRMDAQNGAAERSLRQSLERVEALYHQNKLNFPKELWQGSLVESGRSILQYMIVHPPVPAAPNAPNKWTSSLVMGIITTVVSLTVFAPIWGVAKDVQSQGLLGALFVGGLSGVYYALGRAVKNVGGAMRSKIYDRASDRLLKALEAFEMDEGQEARRELYDSIVNVEQMYRHYNIGAVFSPAGFDYSRLTPSSSNLREAAVATLAHMASSPPVSPERVKRVEKQRGWLANRCQQFFSK